MANKKIKRVNLNDTEYDLAVDGVDKVDGLEERLGKLENNKQAAISDLATIRSNASTGATHAGSTHARTDATKVEDSTTNGNIKINGTETNVYTHPAYTSKAEGLYKVTVDATGHISKATAVTKADITGLGIPGSNTNTTYDLAAAKSKTNGSVTLDLTAGGSGSGTDSVTIKGTGATTVTTDANGVITINSTDNNTVYTHPTYTAKESGLYKVTVDGTGHVSAATAVTKSDITSLGIPGSDTNTTYTIETGDSKGQIKVTPSSGDAYNVDVKGLGSAAYTNSSAYMPAGDTSHGTHVSAATVKSALGTGTGTSKYLREDGAWVTPPNTTYSNATTVTAGLMSSTDKSNLDALVTAWTADGTDDTLINKVEEVVKAFENAPEGTNIISALAGKADKSSLATVATSGSYNDLSNKPTIPTVNNATLTLNVGGQAVSGNNAFTANDATNTTYNVPSATASAYGVVKVSSVNSSAVTVNSESTTAGRYYPVELNSDGKAIVNVPWTDTNTDTDTHYTTGLFVGATNTKSNAATANGSTYLKLYDNDTKRAEFKISGSGATTVTSDANGNIVISSTDTNTASAADNILDGSNSGTTITYAPYASSTATSTWVGMTNNAGKLYLGTVNPSKTTRLNYNGYLYGTKLYSGGKEVLTSHQDISGKVNSHNASMTGSLEIWDSINEYGYINLGFGYDNYDEEGCVKLTHSDSDNYTTYAITGISHKVNSTEYAYSFPTKTGTLALTSDIKSLVSNTTASGGIKYITEASFTNGVLTLESKYLHLS